MGTPVRVGAVKEVAGGVDRRIETPLGRAASLQGNAALYYLLGTPIAATTNRIVTSTNMKVGAYTIAAQPDVPRVITLTRTVVDTADTPGTITITGTNYNDEPISETLTVGAHATLVTGTKAFKRVNSVVGAGWVIDATEGTADTIVVGVGAAIGLPIAIKAAGQVVSAQLGTAFVVPSASADSAGVLEKSLVTLTTWDGAKVGGVFIRS